MPDFGIENQVQLMQSSSFEQAGLFLLRRIQGRKLAAAWAVQGEVEPIFPRQVPGTTAYVSCRPWEEGPAAAAGAFPKFVSRFLGHGSAKPHS